MKTEKWDARLIIDTGQLKNALSFLFGDKLIKAKYGVSGVSNSDWVYGEIPISETDKIFRFAVYLLTGKAVVLFIQSGEMWLTGDWENLLIGGFQCKFKHQDEIIPIDYKWSRVTDLGCGETLTCLGCFLEEDFRSYKQVFVEGLILEYQKLWLKP